MIPNTYYEIEDRRVRFYITFPNGQQRQAFRSFKELNDLNTVEMYDNPEYICIGKYSPEFVLAKSIARDELLDRGLLDEF